MGSLKYKPALVIGCPMGSPNWVRTACWVSSTTKKKPAPVMSTMIITMPKIMFAILCMLFRRFFKVQQWQDPVPGRVHDISLAGLGQNFSQGFKIETPAGHILRFFVGIPNRQEFGRITLGLIDTAQSIP